MYLLERCLHSGEILLQIVQELKALCALQYHVEGAGLLALLQEREYRLVDGVEQHLHIVVTEAVVSLRK